jgi:aspartate-semialdehyde dehydrogenase
MDEIVDVLYSFRAPAGVAELPTTPAQPIAVFSEADRPQPLRDRDVGRGMAVSVGRVRPCPLFHARLVILGHNTVRGAAGGAIHNAELLVAQGWLKWESRVCIVGQGTGRV